MYVCMCMYMYVCMYVCMYVYICRPMYTHVYIYVCVCIHASVWFNSWFELISSSHFLCSNTGLNNLTKECVPYVCVGIDVPT